MCCANDLGDQGIAANAKLKTATIRVYFNLLALLSLVSPSQRRHQAFS
jgi:hypothetical protein